MLPARRPGRKEYVSAEDRSGRRLLLTRIPDHSTSPPAIPAPTFSVTTGPERICLQVQSLCWMRSPALFAHGTSWFLTTYTTGIRQLPPLWSIPEADGTAP